MEVGVQVREISTGSIGVIEKGNNNSYYINFAGRKNWKRGNEIEIISNTILKPSATNKPSIPTAVVLKKSPPTSLARPTGSNTLNSTTPPTTTPITVNKAPTEDPGPRFGNFKFNTTQTLSNSPKYSTLPSKAFFDVSSTPVDKPLNNITLKKSPPISKPPAQRPPIPDFNPSLTTSTTTTSPSANNTNNNNVQTPTSQPKPTTPPPQTTTSTSTSIVKTFITPTKQPTTSPVTPIPPVIVAPITTPPKSNTPHNTNTNNTLSPRIDKDMWNIKLSELEFEQVIGSGKYGEVSLGKWLGTPVAIKKLLECNDETNPIIEREIQILKEIRHPQIVQFLGVSKNKDESEIYIITEFMEGGDLFDSLIFGDQPLSWKEKLKISLDISQSLAYLQAKNILHRDLKSQNILLTSNKRAKLCDLGLARVFDDRINKRLTYVGSERWMAPEISMGELYDFKVDVFSFGIVLVEIITNQIPDERYPQKKFEFDNLSFLKKVPRECPPAFAKLCCDCTQADPKLRPDFTKILQEIHEIYESLPDEEENQDN